MPQNETNASGSGVGGNQISLIPTSIIDDGSVDVTGEIRDWIDSTPNGSTLKFGLNKTYLVNDTLYITDRKHLSFDGNNSTVKQSTDGTETTHPRSRSMFSFINGSDLSIKNIVIHGADLVASSRAGREYVAELEAQHGVNIYSVQRMLVENVQVRDMYGDNVYIGNQGGDLPRNITVRKCRLEYEGRMGIGVTAGEDIMIENNYIGQCRRAVIDIEPNTENGHVRRLMFRGNTIGPSGLLFFANKGADSEIEDITFMNNHLRGKALQVWAGRNGSTKRKRYKFIGNTSDNVYGTSSEAAMTFDNIDGLEVRGNTQPMQPKRNMHIVSIANVKDVIVKDNVLLNAIGSLKLIERSQYGSGNSNYCYSGNKIGNPLKLEENEKPCS